MEFSSATSSATTTRLSELYESTNSMSCFALLGSRQAAKTVFSLGCRKDLFDEAESEASRGTMVRFRSGAVLVKIVTHPVTSQVAIGSEVSTFAWIIYDAEGGPVVSEKAALHRS